MKIFIYDHWYANGVQEVEGHVMHLRVQRRMMVGDRCIPPSRYRLTRDAAVKEVRKLKRKKVASLKRSILKTQKMRIK